jgi:hypothetical protein
MVSLLLACVVGVIGCGTEPSAGDDELPADAPRCRIANADGTCRSVPPGCPVTVGPHSGPPQCPPGTELIRYADDHCAVRVLLCAD